MKNRDEAVKELFTFIWQQEDGQQVAEWNTQLEEPMASPEAVGFELFALRAFLVDYIAYSLIAEAEQRRQLCEPLFAEVLRHAEMAWEDGGEGLQQRLQLYAQALQSRPEEPDVAILSMFCRLCERSDEAFRAMAPVTLLRYVKDIQSILTDEVPLVH